MTVRYSQTVTNPFHHFPINFWNLPLTRRDWKQLLKASFPDCLHSGLYAIQPHFKLASALAVPLQHSSEYLTYNHYNRKGELSTTLQHIIRRTFLNHGAMNIAAHYRPRTLSCNTAIHTASCKKTGQTAQSLMHASLLLKESLKHTYCWWQHDMLFKHEKQESIKSSQNAFQELTDLRRTTSSLKWG